MSRLIDADALYDQYIDGMKELISSTTIEDAYAEALSLLLGAKLITDAPTIDAVEVVRGEWKPFDRSWGRSIWYCTACEECVEVPCDIWTHKPIYDYCPNCGADMREREGER